MKINENFNILQDRIYEIIKQKVAAWKPELENSESEASLYGLGIEDMIYDIIKNVLAEEKVLQEVRNRREKARFSDITRTVDRFTKTNAIAGEQTSRGVK